MASPTRTSGTASTMGSPNLNVDPFHADMGKSPTDSTHTADSAADMHSPDLDPESAAALRVARDRRESREWDAAQVPPSQFQKRKGSVYATPSSRDTHTDSAESRDKSFHDKLKEKGWVK